jgi:hypothetical protein
VTFAGSAGFAFPSEDSWYSLTRNAYAAVFEFHTTSAKRHVPSGCLRNTSVYFAYSWNSTLINLPGVSFLDDIEGKCFPAPVSQCDLAFLAVTIEREAEVIELVVAE